MATANMVMVITTVPVKNTFALSMITKLSTSPRKP